MLEQNGTHSGFGGAGTWLRLLLPAMMVFAGGLVVSVLVYRFAQDVERIRARDRFEHLADEVINRLDRSMVAYEIVLRGGAALFETNPPTTRAQFHTYVSALDIEAHYPGAQGVGYAMFIAPAELAAHEAAVRASGFPEYEVEPKGAREIYSSIIYLEPFDWRNRRAFGFDMFSEAVRREAMLRACETLGPTASGLVVLKQETQNDIQAGVLVYFPVRKVAEGAAAGNGTGAGTETAKGTETGAATDTGTTGDPAQPCASIRGFVYSPFRIARLMESLVAVDPHTLRDYLAWTVHDGAVMRPDHLLYASRPVTSGTSPAPLFTLSRHYTLYGRLWTFEFKSTGAFERSIDWTVPWLVLLSGILTTVLLAQIVGAMVLRQRHLAELNARMSLMTRELGHRVKNTLAVVQAIATRSLPDGRPIGEGREIFLRRLHALSGAHTVLLETAWHGASLQRLAAIEVAAFGARVRVDGPEVELNASVAQTFALVLHELATNAVKHGALAVPGGRAILNWSIEGQGRTAMFRLIWREEGGPVVSPPTRLGFGHTLLSQRIGHGGAPPTITYAPEGLSYEVSAPLAAISQIEGDEKGGGLGE
ncbi:MAG: CHASE domain-containing protein [Hyphomicrobiaceae bacterium]